VLLIFRVQVQPCIVDCPFESWLITKINNRRRQTVPYGHTSFSKLMLSYVYAAGIHRQLVRITSRDIVLAF